MLDVNGTSWHSYHKKGITNCLEGDTGREHALNDGGLGHQPLQPQVEDPLEGLLAEGPQHLQLVQDPGEVLRLPLGLGVVGDVVPQGVDDLGLERLHQLRLEQPVALWGGGD